VDSFHYWKQKWKVIPLNLAHPLYFSSVAVLLICILMPFLLLAGLHRFPTLGEKRNFAFIMATCHPANTFQKHKVLVLTSVLASFSFNPPLDYWWKWHYSICASFSVPIPVYCYNVSVLLNYRCSVWHGWSPISLFLLYWETKLHSASSRMLSLFVILIFDNERSIVIHTPV